MMHAFRLVHTLAFLLLLSACASSHSPASNPRPSPAPPSRAEALAPIEVGLGLHSLSWERINEINLLRVQYVRHTLYPDLYEHSQVYRDEFLAGLDLAFAHNKRVLLVVHQLPARWSAEEFGFWVGERVYEFGERVEAWQIGNEWDTLPGSLSASEYSLYLKAAYTTIKRASQRTEVVTVAIPNAQFARELHAPFDAYAIHVYGPPLADRVREVRAWLPSNARVWITEVGVEQKSLPPANWEHSQAREIREAILAARRSHVERAYIYQLRTDEPEEMHGLIRPDGSWRPAAHDLAARDYP